MSEQYDTRKNTFGLNKYDKKIIIYIRMYIVHLSLNRELLKMPRARAPDMGVSTIKNVIKKNYVHKKPKTKTTKTHNERKHEP